MLKFVSEALLLIPMQMAHGHLDTWTFLFVAQIAFQGLSLDVTVGSTAKEKLLADFHRMDKELGGGSIQPNFMDLHTYIGTQTDGHIDAWIHTGQDQIRPGQDRQTGSHARNGFHWILNRKSCNSVFLGRIAFYAFR